MITSTPRVRILITSECGVIHSVHSDNPDAFELVMIDYDGLGDGNFFPVWEQGVEESTGPVMAETVLSAAEEYATNSRNWELEDEENKESYIWAMGVAEAWASDND